ncbi:MAG: hypothetical protein IKO47_00750 [Ruminococcus sp.]|nr:hypothetical protein [Ruminococcus sp.]
MAYCKYCGKKLSDGEVCDCRGSASAKKNQADVQPEKTGIKGSAPARFMGDHLRIIIIVAAVLLVLIILIAYIVNHTGARGAAREYAKLRFNSSGGSRYYSMTLPDDLYKSLSGDKLDSMVDEFNDENKSTKDDYKIKLKKVQRVSKLKGDALDGAELCFRDNAAVYDRKYQKESYSAKKGYVYRITYKVKDKQTKKTTTYKKQIAVVKFKGEGWKIIDPDLGSMDSMKEYLSSYAENKGKK